MRLDIRYIFCIGFLVLGIDGVMAQEVPEEAKSDWEINTPSGIIALRLLTLRSAYFDLDFEPHVVIGSHVLSGGAQIKMAIRPPDIVILNLFFLYAQLGYEYSLSNLGIPGASHLFFVSGALGISWGVRGTLSDTIFPIGHRRHTLVYQYNYYLDSRATNSANGLLAYFYSRAHFAYGIMFENDALGFRNKDEYRTFGMEMALLFRLGELNVVGGGGGLKIWTGAHPLNNISPFDRRGEVIDLRDNHGGGYPHAILYGTFYLNSFKISVGWDSEGLREIFQNGFHYLINQAALARVDRPDRLFIQLEFNPRFAVY